jgi:CubicO group peptidase (beta-lactamase class C family)
MSFPSLLTVSFVWVLCAAGASAQPPISLPKAEPPPRIDGVLDEGAWQQAATFRDFKTLHPSAGRTPSERTTVLLSYDRENLYVGLHAFEKDPSKIQAQASQRDDPGSDDWIAFCLDTRNDELSALFFMVTPNGIQVDGTLDANGSPNTALDLKWSSATVRTPDGWTAEMSIPFQALPFPGSQQVVMGFKVARFLSRTSEEADFPEIAPDRGPHLSQFQKIQVSGVKPSQIPAEWPPVDIGEVAKRKLRLKAVADIDTYEGRVREWGDASVVDYLVFPARPLKAPAQPFHFLRKPQDSRVRLGFSRLEYLPGKKVEDLDAFLRKTATTSFLVIQNDALLYQNYFNGYAPDSIVTSFSVAKSFTSTLVGIAIEEGLIGGVSDRITKYLPELAKQDERFSRISIRDLLTMASGIRYEETQPRFDNRVTYLDPDLRRAALEKTEIMEAPGQHWLYNNYHPLLLGMILERVTGKTVTEYLQQKLWTPLGMEYSGSWSINRDNSGLEKMESGINGRAIDFAKLGRLFLNGGNWDGKQIVPESWVEQATQPDPKPGGFYEDNPNFYYRYFWWGIKRPGGKSDFYALGNKGQYIYVSPQKNLVIVRNGIAYGLPAQRWAHLFYDFGSTM